MQSFVVWAEYFPFGHPREDGVMYACDYSRPYARVPAIGEHIGVAGIHLPVTAVLWDDDGQVHLHVEPQREEEIGGDWPEDLLASGFYLASAQDGPPRLDAVPEPPSEDS